MPIRPSSALLVLGLLATSPLVAQAGRAAQGNAGDGDIFPFPVERTTLDNGLQVVVVPYDSPGIVAYYTVVRTGSRQEVEAGHSGFAHFFEHIMFRGTEKYPQDVYNDALKAMGADSNAFTTDDWTNYYVVGPSSQLEKIMDLESDRFLNLQYSEDVFRTEALAILGEYNKNASSPFLPLYEKLREEAFEKHTYEHTTMGFLADIKAMPDYYDYSLRFFDRFYRPENVIVLVVGDVDAQRLFEMAKGYYGGWERGYKEATIEVEPPQAGRRVAELEWPTPTRPYLMMGWHTPAFDASSKETAALDLLSQLLFSDNAPLYQELVVDRQLVDFISGGADFHRDPYLFSVTSRIRSEEAVGEVESTLERYLKELQAKPVDEARLERIKSYLRYNFALTLDSAPSVAVTVAEFLNLTGDPDSINRLYAEYLAVTPADIQAVAKKVFRDENQTVVRLVHHEAAAEGGAMAGAAEEGE